MRRSELDNKLAGCLPAALPRASQAFALSDQCLKLLIAQSDNVLLYRNLHPSHDCPRRFESWLKRIIQSFQIG
jgi:hypothetical protein